MIENQSLLSQLEQMLSWKKSKKFYAERLGISEDDVDALIKELKSGESAQSDAEVGNYVGELEDAVVKFFEDVKNGTGEVVFNTNEEIKTLDELIEKCKIDTSRWEITKYVQNYWGNKNNPHWQVKAWLAKKNEENLYQESFINFLKSYSPSSREITPPNNHRYVPEGCLLINKQDSHYNKFDIDGKNDINKRFEEVLNKLSVICLQAITSHRLSEIKYIIGSDEFNSEFTGTTTKGTPQKNILSYHDSFEKICNHEIDVIEMFLRSSNLVNIIYVPGNHDEYVGWHLINWLKTYFRNDPRVEFDISPNYRKYISVGTSAIMLNHGDAIKPAKLAGIFPIEYKDAWSNHDHFYIFTGDKHHQLSQDFNGITFYQLPAFSTATGLWEDKHGYVGAKPEVDGFLIDYEDGITNVFKQYI